MENLDNQLILHSTEKFQKIVIHMQWLWFPTNHNSIETSSFSPMVSIMVKWLNSSFPNNLNFWNNSSYWNWRNAFSTWKWEFLSAENHPWVSYPADMWQRKIFQVTTSNQKHMSCLYLNFRCKIILSIFRKTLCRNNLF